MSGAWRLVIDGPRDGAWNMALDVATRSLCGEGAVPPTLRLYRWRVPTVSVGRFQRAGTVDAAACARRRFAMVRRPTGGRGVLHDDELTYSIVAGTADGIPRGTAASYAHLCAGLAEAYRILGVPAELTARARGVKGSPACYLHATPADLCVGAAKLSGSAQVWAGDTVLQHGSLVVSRDVDAEAEVFRLDPQGTEALKAGTTTLLTALGRRPSLEEMADAVVTGFGSALGVELALADLTDEELARAAAWAPRHAIAAGAAGEVEPSR